MVNDTNNNEYWKKKKERKTEKNQAVWPLLHHSSFWYLYLEPTNVLGLFWSTNNNTLYSPNLLGPPNSEVHNYSTFM